MPLIYSVSDVPLQTKTKLHKIYFRDKGRLREQKANLSGILSSDIVVCNVSTHNFLGKRMQICVENLWRSRGVKFELLFLKH